MKGVQRDLWFGLNARTPARIALGRTGSSLPTREVLAFALAHARARDAVHAAIDADAIASGLKAMGLGTLIVESNAVDRALYLRRPDYGRRLAASSREAMSATNRDACDLAVVIGDGLSAAAVNVHAVPLMRALLPHIAKQGLKLGPVAIARGARVALGDEIGRLLGARAVAVLIGERPGLSSPDSLGVYLTYDPQPGRNDAERNCISNVRAEGLSYDIAALKLAWLTGQALTRGLTGVGLKDESDALLSDNGRSRAAISSAP